MSAAVGRALGGGSPSRRDEVLTRQRETTPREGDTPRSFAVTHGQVSALDRFNPRHFLVSGGRHDAQTIRP
jgi:hypothetical protein